MDSEELFYLTYDPDEIYDKMQDAYMAAGGDVLYPGDEKEMLLRAVQAVLVQAFAGVDNALRMATLRYAVGEYLDLYGQKRNCYRIEAAAAESVVEIKFKATGNSKTLKAGTALTADGEHMYLLMEDVFQTGYEQTVRARVVCSREGSAGNGLVSDTQMQFMVPQEAVESVFCVSDAVGGQEREDDESYRERIRTYGLINITTGPEIQYESVAKNVTSEILDAHAANLGAGKVGVYLILQSGVGAAGILENVRKALTPYNVRPLTDDVQVFEATKVPYTLKVQYRTDGSGSIESELREAIKQYQDWQDTKIGQAFNPDKLMSSLYQAGATRVIWGEGSNFNGGAVQYTEIDDNSHCSGTITLAVIGT